MKQAEDGNSVTFLLPDKKAAIASLFEVRSTKVEAYEEHKASWLQVQEEDESNESRHYFRWAPSGLLRAGTLMTL